MAGGRNAGEGGIVDFHGAFREKPDAIKKEQQRHGFIKGRFVGPGDYRYVVMTQKQNPLFTRSEKRRVRKKVAHKIKGAARKGFARIFGIDLSPGLGGAAASSRKRPHLSSRPTASAGSVRADVISALTNQGYRRSIAEHMVPSQRPGEDFESLFRRAVQKNPGELIIFGNPSRVYGRKQIAKAVRAGNPLPIPPAVLEGLGFTIGEKAADSLTSGKSRKRKKRNPDATDQAKDLFEKFHHRSASTVSSLELQRGNKRRKDFTLLGPLVAVGVDADKYDAKRIALGKRDWENYKVEHWDKMPHLAFMTGSQVESVKRLLEQPDRYLDNCPQLCSSPNGKQLYIVTPDPPEIDLRQFDTDLSKDFVDLGEATFVVYIAKKPDHPYEWVHELGEEGGTRPRLMFDRLKKELFLIGGSYKVEAPGILN